MRRSQPPFDSDSCGVVPVLMGTAVVGLGIFPVEAFEGIVGRAFEGIVEAFCMVLVFERVCCILRQSVCVAYHHQRLESVVMVDIENRHVVDF